VVFVLEVAARPIGGLCSQALRFEEKGVGTGFPLESIENSSRPLFSLEELLLRHALGDSPDAWSREPRASGVMMIPIPGRGVYRRVSGVEDALRVDGVEQVIVTAKEDQLLVPLPEGASYLGFIFARGETPGAVERSLRVAHGRLTFTLDSEVRLTS
jgi:L-aminoacid ligase-like protein